MEPLSSAVISATVSAHNDVPIDPTLLDALNNPRERMTLLKYEDRILRFVKSTQNLIEFPPLANSYQRLIVYRIAQRFRLEHNVSPAASDGIERGISIYRTAETCIPQILLIDLNNGERQSDVTLSSQNVNSSVSTSTSSIKVMRRDNLNSSNMKKVDLSASKKVDAAEKERQYAEARARIFGEENPSSSSPEPSTTTSVTSSKSQEDLLHKTNLSPDFSDATSKSSLQSSIRRTSNGNSNNNIRNDEINSSSTDSSLNATATSTTTFTGQLSSKSNTITGISSISNSTVTNSSIGSNHETFDDNDMKNTYKRSNESQSTSDRNIVSCTNNNISPINISVSNVHMNESTSEKLIITRGGKEKKIPDAGQWKGKKVLIRNKDAERADPDFARNIHPTTNQNYSMQSQSSGGGSYSSQPAQPYSTHSGYHGAPSNSMSMMGEYSLPDYQMRSMHMPPSSGGGGYGPPPSHHMPQQQPPPPPYMMIDHGRQPQAPRVTMIPPPPIHWLEHQMGNMNMSGGTSGPGGMFPQHQHQPPHSSQQDFHNHMLDINRAGMSPNNGPMGLPQHQLQHQHQSHQLQHPHAYYNNNYLPSQQQHQHQHQHQMGINMINNHSNQYRGQPPPPPPPPPSASRGLNNPYTGQAYNADFPPLR